MFFCLSSLFFYHLPSLLFSFILFFLFLFVVVVLVCVFVGGGGGGGLRKLCDRNIVLITLI